ncbi:MAG TPA: peptide ABC transporter substrate-binding protein [Thermomicrobiales bacterium]|nr:peptide ABC transporter substrate-binding protein [Thermomicrobiales bacterium]
MVVHPEPREPRELMQQVITGHLSRRDFVRRAAALGFSASAIAAFLAACGGTSPTATSAPAATTGAATTAPTAAATAAGGAAATTAPTAAATSAAGASPAASASPAGSASPAATGGGGNALGTVTDNPLGKGGGLGPGPTKRGGGGPLKMLWWQAPTILNPHQAQGTKDFDASRLTYEPLASFGPDDKFVPFLAAEIPSAANGGVASDGKSVTWKLKPGVKWSDGQPFSADDVVFTWKYATDKETAAVSFGVYKDIDKVEAVDPNTVKVTFKEVTPGWYTVFTGPNGMILPQHYFKDGMGSAAKNFPGNLKPIGTGPYKVDSFSPGDLTTYSINDNWRDANGPVWDQVQLKGGGDATSAARAVLQTGDYQVAWNLQIEPSILNQLAKAGKGRLELTPNWGIERIAVNFSDPNKEVNGQRSEKNTPHPFQSDPKVREAYTYLCDKDTVAKTLYGPAGQPTGNILTNPKQYVSPNIKWSFDIDKAKSILDAAGYKMNGQYRSKGDVQLSVLFQTSTNSVRQKHQQIDKDAFEKAGIKMELKSIDAGVYFSSDAGNPDTLSHFYADLEMYTNSNSSPDPWDYFESWTSAEIAQKENSWNGAQPNRWTDKDYDSLVAAAKTETDAAKRKDMFIKMNDTLVNEVVVIPQVDRLGPQAFANEIQNPQLTAWDLTPWNIANWTKKA